MESVPVETMIRRLEKSGIKLPEKSSHFIKKVKMFKQLRDKELISESTYEKEITETLDRVVSDEEYEIFYKVLFQMFESE